MVNNNCVDLSAKKPVEKNYILSIAREEL